MTLQRAVGASPSHLIVLLSGSPDMRQEYKAAKKMCFMLRFLVILFTQSSRGQQILRWEVQQSLGHKQFKSSGYRPCSRSGGSKGPGPKLPTGFVSDSGLANLFQSDLMSLNILDP